MAAAKSTPVVPEPVPKVVDPPAEDVKITVRSTPLVSTTPPEVTEKPNLTVHHELTITPSTEASEDLATETVSVPEPEPVKTEEPEPAPVVEPPKASEATPLETVAPPIDDTPKADQKPDDGKTAEKSEEMQSPKVFDTKQYHLPIEEGAAGSKGKYISISLVFLLLLAVAGVIAIDAGWVDIGLKLPFDLIK